MQHRHFKLKLLLVQLISIIPFLLFIFYLFDLWFDVRRSLVFEQNISEAKQTSEYIRSSLNYGLTVSSILAVDTHFYKILTSEPETASLTLKNIVKNAPNIDNIVVVDSTGKPIIASLALTAEQQEITNFDRPYFQQVLRTKKAAISNPLTDRLTNKQLVILSAPIIAGDEVVALVNTSFDLEYIKNNLEKTLPNNSKSTIVLDSDNQVSLYLNKPNPVEGEKSLYVDSPLVAKIKADKVVLIDNQTIPLLDKSVLGAGVLVDDLDWTVISVQPAETIFAPIFRAESAVWLILFASLLFTLAVVSFFLRKVRVIF